MYAQFLRDSLCVSAHMQIMFRYRGVKNIALGRQHWHSGEEEDTRLEDTQRANTAERWDSSMYERVFLSASAASIWLEYNRLFALECRHPDKMHIEQAQKAQQVHTAANSCQQCFQYRNCHAWLL